MKKRFLFYSFCAAVALSLAACSDDDPSTGGGGEEGGGEGGGENPPVETPGSYGAFIVNSGSQAANLPGTLSYLDYETGTVSDDLFYSANGMYIGDTFNDGYIDGDLIYLAVTDSRVFHVIDRGTYKLIKTVQPSTEAGPRHFTSLDGTVYCTLFGSPGYLCKINPETFDYQLLEVGPQPEYVVPFNGKLYVAVSDGYSTTFDNSCIAVVDPATFTVEKTITGIKNPVQLATNGSQLFVASWGEYDSSFKQVNYGIREIVDDQLSEKVYKGNYMALNGNLLYYIDAPWDAEQYTYWVLDTLTGDSNEWISPVQGVYSPNFIAVDPQTENIFVLSYNEGEYGYPSYNTDGYVNVYTPLGTLAGKYNTGVGPTAVFFNVYQ